VLVSLKPLLLCAGCRYSGRSDGDIDVHGGYYDQSSPQRS
jgi:hypothetical protein